MDLEGSNRRKQRTQGEGAQSSIKKKERKKSPQKRKQKVLDGITES